MKKVAPRISGDMTMWKAWIGFHVSHSIGLMLFGSAAEVVFPGWAGLGSAASIHVVGLHLLVQDSFNWALFSYVVLCRGIRCSKVMPLKPLLAQPW